MKNFLCEFIHGVASIGLAFSVGMPGCTDPIPEGALPDFLARDAVCDEDDDETGGFTCNDNACPTGLATSNPTLGNCAAHEAGSVTIVLVNGGTERRDYDAGCSCQ